jgi:uncharacterized protein
MLATLVSAHSRPILLLIGSNLFMTFAWYGHLRFKQVPLMGVIVASWAIAFVEYCMAVPANRWGSAVYTTAQLKTMQEVITLLVFVGFSILYLREPMRSVLHSSPAALISCSAAPFRRRFFERALSRCRARRTSTACSRSAVVEYVEKVPPVRPIRIETALTPYAGGLESEIPRLLRRSLSRVLGRVRPHSIAAPFCVRRRGQRQ